MKKRTRMVLIGVCAPLLAILLLALLVPAPPSGDWDLVSPSLLYDVGSPPEDYLFRFEDGVVTHLEKWDDDWHPRPYEEPIEVTYGRIGWREYEYREGTATGRLNVGWVFSTVTWPSVS
ncbi:hypothetical protein ACFLQU_06180, partial [Verrucomicrobiota bacterium]